MHSAAISENVLFYPASELHTLPTEGREEP